MKNKELFIDNLLRKQALEKIERIRVLKSKKFEYIKGEDSTLDEIREFLKRVDHFENIDMDYERDLA